MKYDTIERAAEQWVLEMDAVDTEMLQRLYSYEPDEWNNVTPPRRYDRVYVYEVEGKGSHTGEITDIDGDMYTIELDDGNTIEIEYEDRGSYNFELEDTYLWPMWGTMWQFHDSADRYWIEEGDGLQALADCGFTIWESDSFGYFFGIDGAGYNFYEEHWIPLYKARGLHWHKEDAE